MIPMWLPLIYVSLNFNNIVGPLNTTHKELTTHKRLHVKGQLSCFPPSLPKSSKRNTKKHLKCLKRPSNLMNQMQVTSGMFVIHRGWHC